MNPRRRHPSSKPYVFLPNAAGWGEIFRFGVALGRGRYVHGRQWVEHEFGFAPIADVTVVPKVARETRFETFERVNALFQPEKPSGVFQIVPVDERRLSARRRRLGRIA